MIAAAETPKGDPPRFDLPATAGGDAAHRDQGRARAPTSPASCEGSDPKLKDEVVVLSAHLDHIGVTPPVNGDGINNGALDNAAGVATTLEVARAFPEAGKRPRRSILFLTVTGEEKGLLGAEYFARNPTVPLQNDRGQRQPRHADPDLRLHRRGGLRRRPLEPRARPCAARRAGSGVALSADPMPEEGLFTRSDHFRFVEVGVPAVFLMTGFQNGGEAKFRGFLANCYHQPCDDLSQPIDYAAGAKFARINYEIARELADCRGGPPGTRATSSATKFVRRAGGGSLRRAVAVTASGPSRSPSGRG